MLEPYKALEEAKLKTDNPKLCERKNMKRLVMPFMCLILVCLLTWISFPVLEINYHSPVPQSTFKFSTNIKKQKQQNSRF